MLRYATLSLLAGAAALVMFGASAEAGKKKAVSTEAETQESRDVRTSRLYRRKPQVRGFVRRRGGYSYAWTDSINTYGDTQSRYSSGSTFRTYQFDRQSIGGPFDSDFFFDSGISPRGGNSPFQY
jgi:hypothetical protein